MGIQSSYLDEILNEVNLSNIVNKFVKFLRRRKDFDGIAIRGMSGAIVGAAVATRLKKPLLIVRKEDQSHSCWRVEGNKDIKRYVIIDDMVATGATVDAIIKDVKEFNDGKLVGIVLYKDYSNGQYYSNKWNCWVKTMSAVDGIAKPQEPGV